MKKKLLITGASGFLGWNIGTFLQEDWELFGTYFSNKNGLANSVQPIHLDLLDFVKTSEIIENLKPDAILHLAANSSTHLCEKNPKNTETINVGVPAHLAKIASEINAHFVFTSSEQVFDGEQFPYFENNQPQPKNVYGQQKLAAEKAISTFENSCIVRIAVLFGNAGTGTRNFMHEWLNKWKNGETVTVFHDEIRSFLSGQSAAQGLFALLNHKAKGIFHLAGSDNISRLAFAELLKKQTGIDNATIQSMSQKEVNTFAFRPANLSLDCRNAEDFGFEKRSILEEFSKLF